MKPNLFIVGAPKCGTTSLWYYLNQHPEVFMVPGKEPQYFNDDMEFKNSYNEAEYLALYKEARLDHKYLGEASPLYLMSENAAKNIYDFNPDAKIIIMLRNPAEVLFSCYLQNRVNQVEDEDFFETALSLESVRRQGLSRIINGQPIQRLFYSQFVQFEEQITRFFDVFGSNAIHFILFDNLKEDTKKEVEKVYQFLSISTNVDVNYEIQNMAKQNRNLFFQRLIDDPPSWLRSFLRFFLSDRIRSRIYWFMWWSNKKRNSIKLEDVLRKELNEEYVSEINYVSGLLGVKLDHWV